MTLSFSRAGAALIAAVLVPCGYAQTFKLDSTQGLQPHDVRVESVTYQDRKAVRVVPSAAVDAELVSPKNGEGGGIVEISGSKFHDGIIEVDVAGKPRAGATGDARGFVGVAFRVATDPSGYRLTQSGDRADRPPCTRSCVFQPAHLPPSYAWLSSFVIWSSQREGFRAASV